MQTESWSLLMLSSNRIELNVKEVRLTKIISKKLPTAVVDFGDIKLK